MLRHINNNILQYMYMVTYNVMHFDEIIFSHLEDVQLVHHITTHNSMFTGSLEWYKALLTQ